VSHEVPEPLLTHFLMVVLHTKPLQHDLPNKPEHFLPALAQPSNLNIFISKIDIDWKSKGHTFFHDELFHRYFLLEPEYN
jgi:hypothetical protein